MPSRHQPRGSFPRDEIADLCLGLGPDAPASLKAADQLTVRCRQLPEIGGSHAGLGEERGDIIKEGAVLAHAPTISAIADTSSACYRGRAKKRRYGIAAGMENETWRTRLEARIAQDGRTMRDVSLSAGLSAGYVHGILKDGKDPTIDRLSAVARALNVSLAYVLVGVNISPEAEEIVRVLEEDPVRRDAVLSLLGLGRVR